MLELAAKERSAVGDSQVVSGTTPELDAASNAPRDATRRAGSSPDYSAENLALPRVIRDPGSDIDRPPEVVPTLVEQGPTVQTHVCRKEPIWLGALHHLERGNHR
jgi:hypothetical protein